MSYHPPIIDKMRFPRTDGLAGNDHHKRESETDGSRLRNGTSLLGT